MRKNNIYTHRQRLRRGFSIFLCVITLMGICTPATTTYAATEEEVVDNPEGEQVITEETVLPEEVLENFTLYTTLTKGTTSAALNLRTGPGTSYDILTTIPSGTTVTLLGKGYDSSKTLWYQISYDGYSGYASSTYIKNVTSINIPTDTEFEAYLTAQGFPESYKDSLRILHYEYPDWTFVAQKTGLDWSTVVSAEYLFGDSLSSGGTNARSLVSASSLASWKSTDDGAYDWTTGEWITGWDGSSWVIASKEIIAYYLDPRNFLDSTYIFQFLDLSYNSTQTENVVAQAATSMGASWLSGSYTHADGTTINYPSVIAAAGKSVGLNPIALVSIIVQELGTNGATKSIISGTVSDYLGIYNYYNIGAYTDATFSTAYMRGLWYASLSGSYSRPWNSRETAITGGAAYFYDSYVAANQNTLYLKRFNVMNSSNLYNHQFSTNIQAAASEGKLMSKAYTEALRTETELTFYIPVYENMPSTACAMPTGNDYPGKIEAETEEEEEELDFVTNLYVQALGRKPTTSEKSTYDKALSSGTKTAAQVAAEVIFGTEYTKKNTSNSSYVKMLYLALLGRSSDTAGYNEAITDLSNGLTRKYVFATLINSSEFKKVCSSYGIKQGSYTSTEVLDKNPDVTAFVSRLYTVTLGRSFDTAGLTDWVTQLNSGKVTATDVAYGFVFSSEYQNKKTSDSSFVTMCYNTFLNRSPDSAGKASWVEYLTNGCTRYYVFAGFVNSTEFTKLCKSYGITKGSYTSTQIVDKNPQVTAFVSRMYTTCLKRSADSDGLTYWVKGLLNGTYSGSTVAKGFFLSQEFTSKNLSNSEFVNRLYKTILNRDPDSAGKADWVNRLSKGTSRSTVLSGFLNSTEFTKLCKQYGITR